MKMTVGVVGLGLIGASFAKAYKSDEEATVYGWNRTKSITQMAQMQGIIDEELTDENLGKCDLVILSLYPEASINWMEAHKEHFNKDGMIIDACGTKRLVCEKCFKIAEENGLFVLEDAAQGFGGSLHGKRNGSFGDVAATSFFPAKPLGCYGDGGAIFTDNEELYNVMHSIRVHGQGSDKYDNVRLGLNGRMDTIQCAVVLAKLTVFEDELKARQDVADWYDKYLDASFDRPLRDKEYFSAWAQYTVLAKDEEQRSKIVAGMKEKDIPVMIYYPIPLHQQTAYKNLGYGDVSLPYCESVAKRVFSLPMHPYLKEEEVKQICEALNSVAAGL